MNQSIENISFLCGRNKVYLKCGEKVIVRKDGEDMGLFEIIFYKSMFCAKYIGDNDLQLEWIEPLHRDPYFLPGGEYEILKIDS